LAASSGMSALKGGSSTKWPLPIFAQKHPVLIFFSKFCDAPKVAIVHPLEDLAKSGYEPDIKHESSIALLHSWLLTENQI